MITYVIEEVSQNNFKCSAYDGDTLLINVLYELENEKAYGKGFYHPSSVVDPTIIRELMIKTLEHLFSLGVPNLITYPISNKATLSMFVNNFEKATFFDMNGEIDSSVIKDFSYYASCYSCQTNMFDSLLPENRVTVHIPTS
jgi:hypothetical protein